MSLPRTDIVSSAPSAPIHRSAGRLISRVLVLVAALLLASMLAGALHDVSRAWDVGYYHLPFAARLGGILPADTFVFHSANEARFAGFPLLGELLQGILWRLTGRAEATNLVAFASVPLFAWFLRRRFDVPLPLSTIALLAIPLVHTHATSCYVDLPANAAASVLVLLAIDAHAKRGDVSVRTLILAGLSAAIAINMKALLHPIVAVALVALALRIAPSLVRDLTGKAGRGRARAVTTVIAIVVSVPLLFATPLKNAYFHGNPYYPVRLQVMGHTFPGPEDPYASSPDWLENAPRPLRFGASLLEIGARPYSDRRRWTIDQWMPSDADGYRMGGFFGAYVVAMLALLVHRVARERSRTVRVAGIGFALLTAITSVMPQSHELRYYMEWMIVLVAINLWLACRKDAASIGIGPRFFTGIAILGLAAVLGVTRGGYATPTGTTFADLVHEQVSETAFEAIHEGDRICVDRPPWNILWAAPFQNVRARDVGADDVHKKYVVKEAEQPGECAGYSPVP